MIRSSDVIVRENWTCHFSNTSNKIKDQETYKMLRPHVLRAFLEEFKEEVPLVEFSSREKMKIIDGDSIERAEEII